MKNKDLLDSFIWIENTGKTPSCEYVEVKTSWWQTLRGKPANFHWWHPQHTTKLINLDRNTDNYIIKYREISKEEYDLLGGGR